MSDAQYDLSAAALAEMHEEGFTLTHSPDEAAQLQTLLAAPLPHPANVTDFRSLPWSSVDNDTSRDLDQIEFAEQKPDGIRVLIGIADVAEWVKKDTPIDQFAHAQTQTVYTTTRNFPMLPNELSTGLTSLNPNEDRLALVTEFIVTADGELSGQKIYSALVHNTSQLAYSHIGPFLEGKAPLNAPDVIQQQLHLQDQVAQQLRAARNRAGALDFRRSEAQPIMADGKVQNIQDVGHNRAMDMIEDLMIAANETVAVALHTARRSSIRRIVKSPERWQRIVDLVKLHGTTLPATPDALALNRFLGTQLAADPDHYPDLALSIIKLMGAGEYVLSSANDAKPPAHFALAAQDYSHSTAPNRRFADLVTQRLLKAMIANQPAPYTDDELASIADQCNKQDKAARKVERGMMKRVSAVAMGSHIGQVMQGVITGASNKGVFVRVFNPPVEGKIVRGDQGLDVGDRVTVKLVHTDPVKAFIDFERVQ